MQRYVQVKKPVVFPQSCGLWKEGDFHGPVFMHATVDQDRPIGSQATFRRHTHSFYHIVLYTRGKGEYFLDGRYFPAIPGTCVLVHPGQRHDFISRRQTGVYSELTFSYLNHQDTPLLYSFEQLLALYSGLKVTPTETLQLSTENRHILQNLLTQIIDYLNSRQEVSIYYAHRTLGQIFDFLIEQSIGQIDLDIVENRFVRARMWIEEHYLESFLLDDLAKSAGVSKGYFFRAFKKLFGTTPVGYQQQLRVEAAKTLLKATSLKCNEISFRVGFSDVYYFHRVFRKHTGTTPQTYRKKALSHPPQND